MSFIKKIAVILFLFLLALTIYFINKNSTKVPILSNKPPVAPDSSKSISSTNKVKYPQDYTIVMVGDSMTETLGNSTEIKDFLSKHYPGKSFEVLNYGYGSTNILSVVDRITKETQHGRAFRPINQIDYDLLLLESFGQNPLSQYPLEEGLKRQTQELDKIVKILKQSNPRGKIVFVLSISPNKKIFAKNQVELSPQVRAQWVDERISYMKNHETFAKANNIPVINIFEKSLLENGDGNPDYISKDDYIHPSPTGIIFISKQIADFIYENKILP